MLVRPAAALRQLEVDAARQAAPAATSVYPAPLANGRIADGPGARTLTPTPLPPTPTPTRRQPRQFYGAVRLDPRRMASEADAVAQEVVQYLAGLFGAEVEETLEISASVPQGVLEHVIRAVAENRRTLRFRSAEFEEGG